MVLKVTIRRAILRLVGRFVPRIWRRRLYDLGHVMKVRAFRLFARGSTFECCLCGHTYGRFLTGGRDSEVFIEHRVVGGGRRTNSICPYCESSDRERLVYLFLRDGSDLFHGPRRLLHLAPERNLQRVLRQRDNIDYVSADLDSPLGAIRVDVTTMPFPSGTFDCVICNHVLEHVPDDRRAMSELFRVLRPGGWAILQVPIAESLSTSIEDPSVRSPEERLRRFGQSDHVRLYGRDYRVRLESAGFIVDLWNALSELGALTVRRHAVNTDEILHVCRRASSSSPGG